jgi:hypothetical protein
VQAEVKSFEWLDLERDPDSATAEGSTLLTIVAGPAGEPGAETFQVTDGMAQRFGAVDSHLRETDRRLQGIETTLTEVVRRLPEPS